MADCQIKSISDQPSNSKDVAAIIPEGRVGQVCKEWLIREDGNLAYRLQNEEIEQHYNENRSKNQLVRKDIPLAKHLQKNEILEAQQKYERFLQEQIDHDEKMARKIERRLLLEEEEAKKAAEEADAKLAKKLMEKEKAKQIRKRIEKEKQQVERLSAQIGTDLCSLDIHEQPVNLNQKTLDRYARSKNHRIMTEDEQELDLSEFCMPPPPGLNPEELKLFLEEQDAEIAQLLQHQELKRNRNPVKEKLALIEQQDFEIAKMLQKMEKERYKKIKEKLRNNQRLNRSTDQDSNFRVDLRQEDYQRTSTPLSSMESSEPNKVENDYDIPENHLTSPHDQTYEEPYNLLSETTLAQSFHNIAIDLDPTYKRRLKQSQCSSSQGNLTESCVDDDDDDGDNDYRVEQINKTGSPISQPTHRSYRDSFEKLHSTARTTTSGYIRNPPSTCTSSSRSSNTSSENRNLHNQEQQKSDDFAPPLPPRDMSLMHNYKPTTNVDPDHQIWKESIRGKIVSNNLLPPHHPQHPNRQQNNDFLAIHPLSDNDQSSSSTINNALVQGQWRMASIEKPQKKMNKSDGCRTQ
ncbi:Coiled-coil domain-containing protein [Euroglyphus maynei]|uniref:Coiled-coil domain-containing protein n=1 Tax=Euroglyphus maynei TaxID=6958 RepID=A0A1Y3AXY1_EURMA|nr:Coiled-coil domain-containing protein [Euroglyphus maynei]